MTALPMTEAQWQERVQDTLTTYGWLWCHYRPAQTGKGWRTPLSGHKGCPDLIIAGHGLFVGAELKTDDDKTSKPTAEQAAWLKAAGASAAIWRPRHWPQVHDFIAARGRIPSPVVTG
jgi:hypothetical protein